MTDEYEPADRPPGDIPGGDRVRFEREGGVEQSLLGGNADEIAESIMKSTERNVQLIGQRIMGVGDIVGNLGSGDVMEIVLHLANGKDMKITGFDLRVEFT